MKKLLVSLVAILSAVAVVKAEAKGSDIKDYWFPADRGEYVVQFYAKKCLARFTPDDKRQPVKNGYCLAADGGGYINYCVQRGSRRHQDD